MERKLMNIIKAWGYTIVLIIALFTYIWVWVNITLLRLDTLNALWADLGIAMERGWLVYNNDWNLSSYLFVFFNSGILFFTFPLTIPQSFSLLLVVQTIVIGTACLPIFGIANYFLKNNAYSAIVAALFLIYFPISGLNWYDFHYQAFFPLFFLLGYYFYLKDHKPSSFLLFFLSAIVRFPYAVFVLIFSIILLIEKFHSKGGKFSISKETLVFPVTLLLLSAFLLIGAYQFNGSIAYVSATVGYGGESGLFDNFTTRIETVLYVFIPLGFLPLLSKRWFVTYIPYMALVIYVGGYGKVIPTAFHYQYTAMIAPFVFLGLIDILNKIKLHKSPTKHFCKSLRLISSHTRTILISIIILSIFSATLFEPYSPVNKYTFDSFSNFANYEAGNASSLGYLNQVMSYIPKNNSSVLTQFNIPEIFPRTPIVSTYPNEIYVLVSGYSALSQINNLTLSDVRNNTYNITIFANHEFLNLNVHIYYVLAYTNSPWYFNNDPSMQDLIKLMNESGRYGTVADYKGFILLEWGYKGPIKLKDV